ncbi:MAG: DUF4864 domain-containing protein [Parachlamydiaceae bacterium]|nr:DUF4864 domain-containing protein [Parachlamydiaceae bacterium]
MSEIEIADVAAGFSIGGKDTQGPSVDWLRPIDTQLRHLRNREIDKAYQDAASSEFKSVTTEEDFTKFINRYPIFFSHTSMTVETKAVQSDEAEITVLLNPEKEAVPVNYLLKREPSGWKIWSMNVAPTFSEKADGLLKDPMTLRVPVEGLFEALHNKDVSKAYREYTSQAFREATPIDGFRKFLQNFPAISDFDEKEYRDASIEKTTGKLEVGLFDPKGTTIVEYTLGIEEDQWKIWGIRIVDQNPQRATVKKRGTSKEEEEDQAIPVSTPEASVSTMMFPKVEVGTGLNLKGEIADPSAVLKSPHGEIYVNLYVVTGNAHVRVNVHLEHVDSHSRMPAVSTTLQQDGDSVLSFSFSSPPQGWPKGRYQIKVSTSTGLERTFTFSIE